MSELVALDSNTESMSKIMDMLTPEDIAEEMKTVIDDLLSNEH